jgi:CDP-6-deoxy-D-xylo-4-hexulose-3-dehydrase
MIKLAQDTIDKEDFKALSEWLLTEPRLTKGPITEEFENQIAMRFGRKYSVMVNSGSSANLLALHALLHTENSVLRSNKKVILPALSWATDLAPVMQLGFSPYFCDMNMRNLGVDTGHLEDLFKNVKPSVFILVSVLGMPPDMDEIDFLCRKYKVKLICDNCESLGSKYDERPLESYGDMSTMSFYFGHHISTIEGGLVFTDDDQLYDILRMTRAHGWDRDLPQIQKEILKKEHNISDFNSRYTFYYPGFNFRPTEINAFLGLRQMNKMSNFIKRRKENFEFYQRNISNDFWKPEIPEENYVSNLGYPIIHPNRDKIVKALESEDIECRPLISGNMAKQPFFTNSYGHYHDHGCKNVTISDSYGMYIPNHPSLSVDDLTKICKIVNSKIS